MNIQISLKSDVFDLSERLDEVQDIRDWINELVLWDKTLYQLSFHSSGEKMIAWFEHDEHATLFALKYA